MQMAAVAIQAKARSFMISKKYKKSRIERRTKSASKIQATFKAFLQRRKFMTQKRALMKCQGNVLCRQIRRAYVKLRKDTVSCQALLRRFLAVTWFERVKIARTTLESNLDSIRELIHKHNIDAEEFKGCFTNKSISAPFKHLASLEEYELTENSKSPIKGESTALPKLYNLTEEVKKLKAENSSLQKKIEQLNISAENKAQEEEKEWKEKLGPKYNELPTMITKLKQDLSKLNEYAKNAKILPIRLQHPYSYSKWDKIHEPDNLVENILVDDQKIYKGASPAIDLTLNNGIYCFVAEIIVYGAEPFPAKAEVYVSNVVNRWTLIKDFTFEKQSEIHLQMPGEQVAKYLRVKFTGNVRGGNIVGIRLINVKGIIKGE